MEVIRPADDGPLIVTGGARGIGLAAAREAAPGRAGVALLDRDAAAVGRAAAGLAEETGTPVLGLHCDVADEHAVDAAVDRAAGELGGLGALVTAAGIDRGGLLHELPAAAWDAVLAVNLRGTFLACRAALRHMLAAGGGAIVCVASPFALVAPPGGAGAYSASKGGIVALVRSLAVDYAQHGIRVNALLPGPTETELMWASVPAADVDALRATVRHEVPLGRLADPAEPARAARWLLSGAASYVTGSQLACDGGVLARASVSV